MQLEMVCLNSACATDVKSLIDAVKKLTVDTTHHNTDNMALKIQVQDLQSLVDVHYKLPKPQPQSPLFTQ